MDESMEKLRGDFYAHTDINVGEDSDSWKEYAQWLETLSIKQMNSELLTRHNRIMDSIDKVVNILEQAMTQR